MGEGRRGGETTREGRGKETGPGDEPGGVGYVLWVYDVCQCSRCWVCVQYAHTVLYADLVRMRQQPQLFDLLLSCTPRPPSTLLAAVSGYVIAPSCRHYMELSSPALVEVFVVRPKPQIVAVLCARILKDIRMPEHNMAMHTFNAIYTQGGMTHRSHETCVYSRLHSSRLWF